MLIEPTFKIKKSDKRVPDFFLVEINVAKDSLKKSLLDNRFGRFEEFRDLRFGKGAHFPRFHCYDNKPKKSPLHISMNFRRFFFV